MAPAVQLGLGVELEVCAACAFHFFFVGLVVCVVVLGGPEVVNASGPPGLTCCPLVPWLLLQAARCTRAGAATARQRLLVRLANPPQPPAEQAAALLSAAGLYCCVLGLASGRH